MMEEIKKDNKEKMDKSIDALMHDFKNIRTGRANISLLDDVLVDAYGSKMPVNQLANLSQPEPRSIVIEPWDKGVMHDIEKAIQKSDLNLTPVNDGKVLRLNFPQLTEERRKELVKQVKQRAEEGKVAIRNIRRDSNDHVKTAEKDGHLSKDEIHHVLDEIQKATDQYIDKIGQLTEKKEKEIMEI